MMFYLASRVQSTALGGRCAGKRSAAAVAPTAAAAAATYRSHTRRSWPTALRVKASSTPGPPASDGEGPANSKATSSSGQEGLQQPAPTSSPPAAETGPSPSAREQQPVQPAPAAADTAAEHEAAGAAAAAASTSGSPLPDAAAASGSGNLGAVQSSGAGASTVGGGGGAGGPSAVTLLSWFNGVGYTFVLAGFLKIMTVGGLSLSAPTDVARTAFGKATPYLMVPVGLGLCWIAKQVVDTGLNESKRFLQYLAVGLVVVYFGLVKLMYKYEPQTDWVRRPRPRMPGQMAELRSQLGDRELLAAGDMDSARFYQAERPGSKELYDDVAWYEGRYPSQLAAPGQQQKRGAARRAALAVTDTEEEYSMPADSRQGPRARLGASAEGIAAVNAPARRSFLGDNTR